MKPEEMAFWLLVVLICCVTIYGVWDVATYSLRMGR